MGPIIYLPMEMVQEMNEWLGHSGFGRGGRSRGRAM